MRILRAQFTGFDSLDQRLDVFATAIRLGATVWPARNGHQVLDLRPEGPGMVARLRKGGIPIGAVGGAAANPVAARLRDKSTFVVFSGDFDKVLAARFL